jgi:hypothetical protein
VTARVAGRAPVRRAGVALGLAVLIAAAPATGAALLVVDAESGIAETVPLGPGGRWCLHWNHSVTGIAVADCFRTEGERMVLETSRHRDVPAGLGESPGAVLASDGAGGYLLAGLERPVPEGGLVLRRAEPAVAQRIALGAVARPLPPGRVGARVIIRLAAAAPPAAVVGGEGR